MPSSRSRTLAVIPVYRDIDIAQQVLTKVTDRFVDTICLMVDGAPTNNTENCKTPAGIPVKVFNQKERKGIGHAIKRGINYGLTNGYDFVVVLAGNNKDDPQEIPRLLEPILKEDYDYIQGSRFLPGGKPHNTPLFRKTFIRIYPFFWTMVTSERCTDVTNGFRAYKLKLLRDSRINIQQSWLDSYQLEYYLHYKFLTLGYKFKEVPVSKVYAFRHKGGYSKISPLRDWWKVVGPLIYLTLGIKE